jgi:hypothetical protein
MSQMHSLGYLQSLNRNHLSALWVFRNGMYQNLKDASRQWITGYASANSTAIWMRGGTNDRQAASWDRLADVVVSVHSCWWLLSPSYSNCNRRKGFKLVQKAENV